VSEQPETSDLSPFQASIAAIRSNFVSNLGTHLDALEPLVLKISEPQSRAVAITRVCEISHKIHGVAGTFGFAELGRIATEAELATTAPLPDLQDLDAVESIIHKVCDLIDCIVAIRTEEAAA